MKSPAKYGNHKLMVVACLALSLVIASYAEGQRFGGQGYGGQGFGGSRRSDPTVFDRNEFPMWEIKKPYAKDVFTFVRIKTQPSWNRSSNRNWTADYPDADFYFSWRLHQLTSLQVNPDPITLELTDPQLNDFPFVFLAAPQSVDFSAAEVTALREYLLNGGFMMCDEFFGTIQWDLFHHQLKRVFPEFEPVELNLSHEIFHMVYDLDFIPQVPAIHFWQRLGITYHPVAGTEVDNKPHFFGLHDAAGRMMVLICHNNDIQDGWEREGEDKEFFTQFSVRQSYPMGINIVTYALTH
ncbi:MAG: DUF4159 domain-containing protein [Planctomycetales bacterium]|nr:DUF4159 domain-containing protein [Planctomycetales bacterium]